MHTDITVILALNFESSRLRSLFAVVSFFISDFWAESVLFLHSSSIVLQSISFSSRLTTFFSLLFSFVFKADCSLTALRRVPLRGTRVAGTLLSPKVLPPAREGELEACGDVMIESLLGELSLSFSGTGVLEASISLRLSPRICMRGTSLSGFETFDFDFSCFDFLPFLEDFLHAESFLNFTFDPDGNLSRGVLSEAALRPHVFPLANELSFLWAKYNVPLVETGWLLTVCHKLVNLRLRHRSLARLMLA